MRKLSWGVRRIFMFSRGMTRAGTDTPITAIPTNGFSSSWQSKIYPRTASTLGWKDSKQSSFRVASRILSAQSRTHAPHEEHSRPLSNTSNHVCNPLIFP